MAFVIPAPSPPSVAVLGTSDRFPIRRIFCVGRNYAAHAEEMGHNGREAPFFFCKPADSVVDDGAVIPYPPDTHDLHHEVELVIALKSGGAAIPAERARGHIWGAAVGVDLTRRDRQAEAKAKGRPWAFGKAFDRSAPIGPLRLLEPSMALGAGRIALSVNGTVRQEADLAEMIWAAPDIIAQLSRSIALAPGDLIMTGTPAGVGPLSVGDHVACAVAGVGDLTFSVGPKFQRAPSA
ncbi:MAG: fumarylacetoacetate hydrolase family protein [Pseudomonadota bacterium]